MSYDYEKYDGKRIVVDGEIIGVLAMEFGHEVEEVWEEYHAELAMTEEQERQSEAYKESLRRALSAQYEKVATLEAENAKLRKLVVLGIMLPLNEEQLDWLDKTFVSEFGEGLYVQLENLGIEVEG